MVRQKQVTSVLNKFKKRDSWFHADYSVNPYEGCSCNCQYCYVRGSKYGENMDDGLIVKINLPELLEKQLKSRTQKNQYGFVVVGSATDAYLPHEREWKLTEKTLELLLKYRFPVFISTKFNLVTHDIEILKEIDKQAILPEDLKTSIGRGVIFSVSVSTINEKISKTLEPGAISPIERLQLLQYFKRNGFLAGVNAIPLLPFISDTNDELEKLFIAIKEYGADYILAGGLTLFGDGAADSKTLYYKFLERFNPSFIRKYNALYQGFNYTNHAAQDILHRKIKALCQKYSIRNSITI